MTTTGYLPPGATWVPNTANREALEKVGNYTLEDRGIAIVDGPVGLGKTTELLDWAASTGLPYVYVDIDDQAQPAEMDILILRELGIATCDSMRKYERKLLLREALAETNVIVMTDEVGKAPLATLRRMRTHHDRRGGNWTWFLIGKGSLNRVNQEPDLLSRTGAPIIFEPLSDDELLEYLPQFHPMYKHSDPELLTSIDQALGERDNGAGNPRSWGQFTRWARPYLGDSGTVDKDVAELTLSDLDKRPIRFRK